MFRNPRGTLSEDDCPQPSVGRPPSPPPGSTGTNPKPTTAAMPTKTVRPRQTALPTVKSTPAMGARMTPAKKASVSGSAKTRGKTNGSILSFFKKAEPQDIVVNGNVGGLFFEDTAKRETPLRNGGDIVQDGSRDGISGDMELGFGTEDLYGEGEISRFNENNGSIKRRKLSHDSMDQPVAVNEEKADSSAGKDRIIGACTPPPPPDAEDLPDRTEPDDGGSERRGKPERVQRSKGPFVEESDSEDEILLEPDPLPMVNGLAAPDASVRTAQPDEFTAAKTEKDEESERYSVAIPPLLKRESTSYPGEDDFADFEGIEDYDGIEDFDDEYADGEEFVERRWMREQRRLELAESGFEGDDLLDEIDDFGNRSPSRQAKIKPEEHTVQQANIGVCPVCSISFESISDQDASVHVNHCLDGKPTVLPERESEAPMPIKAEENSNGPKFRRPVRPARPGQENPFKLGSLPTEGTSAFSTLMSNHAEDRAWAAAATAEHASRGKPSYQRTCPFYKILPGFFIVVDGFRYGAVKGTQAYFLSHFHSDHYIGLTASWCHGPIYCSRVTANLVRQVLRVDPKWIVALEFEKKLEVPGTDSVYVTMIPANHCPGSSLYLFEKAIGKGKNPRVQRVLHCGDFRACPAHLDHPLLRPDVVDLSTGKERQQKIDVCYLDTTYLNPKYAFPSQDEVIRACADMCVSLNKVRVDETDGWEEMKRQRAGSGMVNFVRKDSDSTEVKDKSNEDALDAMKVSAKGSNIDRGRLLVVVGTYSIGKERVCLGIARALDCKIYAPPSKQRICACLEDPELNARLTTDPRKAQVHMTPLFEIRAETLEEYLRDYTDTFTRVVGFRPTGWNYRPPNSRFTESPAVQTVLYSENWKSSYSTRELVPQRGSTTRASCFGVPYSEHSSFRELSMFCCALRIEKIIPTVNVGSAKGRERMKAWCERWAVERKKNGLFKLGVGKAVW